MALLDDLPLGDALIRAKSTASDSDVRATFELFGDPSARMVPPKTGSTLTSAPQLEAAAATGCGTPGNPALAILPLVMLVLLGNAKARRSVGIRVSRLTRDPEARTPTDA